MALRNRKRVVKQVTWTLEEQVERDRRRQELCELDGLLMQLEETNIKGRAVPVRVLLSLRRHGIVVTRDSTAAELIEAVFDMQERYMRHPAGEIVSALPAAEFRRTA